MGIKDQLVKIKENWFLIAVVIALLLFMNIGSFGGISQSMDKAYSESFGGGYNEASYSKSAGYYPTPSDDFAPEIEERKITKTASISSEVKRGSYKSAEQNLKNIVSSSSSFILNENVNKYGSKRAEYYQGNYQLKVDTRKYDSVISQLKQIGDVNSFNENMQDITGQYNNAQINLETEKSRLERYQQLYIEAKDIKDKLDINDRMFDQERKIKYLEDAIANIDQKIEYSTVYFSPTEKRSDYANVILVKFSALVMGFVNSFNSLMKFIFSVTPWAIFFALVWIVWRFFKRKRKK